MRKRLFALLLSLAMVVGLLPATVLAAGATDTWAVKLHVSENDTVKYNNQSTLELGFGVQSDNLTLKTAQGIVFVVDLEVFDIISKSGNVITGDEYEKNNFKKLAGKYVLESGKFYSSAEEGDVEWNTDYYFTTDETGKIGFITLELSQGKDNCSVQTELILSKILLGFKEGKSKNDLKVDSIRFATKDEAKNLKRMQVVLITNGGTQTQKYRAEDTSATLLSVDPSIDWGTLTPAKPALEGTISLSGTAKFGQTLTVVTTGITSTDTGELTYKWYRGETLIKGETDSSYLLKNPEDVGKTITVKVSAANYSGELNASTTTVLAMDGAVTIDKINPRIGDTLTATVTGHDTSCTNISYKFVDENGTTLKEGTENTLVLTTEHRGKKIKVEATLSYSAYSGTLTSAATNAVAKKAAPAKPTGLSTGTYTDTTITLNPIEGCEYSRDNGESWQVSNVFEGLNANTTYHIIARVRETTDTEAGKISDAIDVTTKRTTQTISGPDTVEVIVENSQALKTLYSSESGENLTFEEQGTLPTGSSFSNGVVTAGNNTGSFQVKITAAETNVYNAAEKTITVTIVAKQDAGVSIESNAPTSKTYGDGDFTLKASKTASGDGTWAWTSSDDSILKIVAGKDTDTVTLHVNGASDTGATLTVSFTSGTHTGSATHTITVAPKTLTKTNLKYTGNITKEYDGSTTCNVTTIDVKSDALVGSDSLTITGTAVYNSANVYEATKVTFTPGAITTGNYRLAASETLDIPATITPKTVTPTIDDIANVTYSTSDAMEPAVTVKVDGNTLTKDTDYIVRYENNTEVGTATVWVSAMSNRNYTWGHNVSKTFEIVKGASPSIDTPDTCNVQVNRAQTGVEVDLASLVSGYAGASIKSATEATDTGNLISNVTKDGCKVKFDVANISTTGTTATITVVFEFKNHNDATVTLTVKTVDKINAQVEITGVPNTVTYGDTFTLTARTTTAGVPTDGTWSWRSINASVLEILNHSSNGITSTATVKALKAFGTSDPDVKIIAAYESTTHADEGILTLVRVEKAKPAGTPSYTAITTSGKTLADAHLNAGTITPAGGTIAWNDSTSTVVTANTAYGWTYTPADADAVNYTTLTGTLVPYTVSTGGGGGGGGGGAASYTVTTNTATNGKVTASTKNAAKGSTVTITVTPDKGYQLKTLTVLDKNGNAITVTEKDGKFTFTMPAGKVDIQAAFEEESAPASTFEDVPQDSFYYDAVKWAVENGITTGVSESTFAPDASCTRAEIVTFLWRLAGCPEPKGGAKFDDVSDGAWYAKAVAWAVENGITLGVNESEFAPEMICDRAQAVTFLHRAAGNQAVSGDAAFSDVSLSDYFAMAVAWAQEHGITEGIGGGLFGGSLTCTRAQIVTFLYRSAK